MSAPFTQLGCALEPVLPTSRSTYVRNITLLSAFVWELEVLKVGRFLRFLRFLLTLNFCITGNILRFYFKHSLPHNSIPWQQ